MKNNNPMGSDDEVPEIMTEQPNPWGRGKGNNGKINYDGNQHNGLGGSPNLKYSNEGQNSPDFGGINYDNTQIDFGSVKMSMDDNMGWEKKNGVLIDPTKKFNNIHNPGFEHKEVDLSKHIDCVGMPNDNINHNSSDDCYGS